MVEKALVEFRAEHPEWAELREFFTYVNEEGVLKIVRARNTAPPRTDGDYRPL